MCIFTFFVRYQTKPAYLFPINVKKKIRWCQILWKYLNDPGPGTRDELTSFISFVHRSLTTHFVFCFFNLLKKTIVWSQNYCSFSIYFSLNDHSFIKNLFEKIIHRFFLRSSFQKSFLSVKNLSFFKAFGKFVRSEKNYSLFVVWSISNCSFFPRYFFISQTINFVRQTFVFFWTNPFFTKIDVRSKKQCLSLPRTEFNEWIRNFQIVWNYKTAF